MSIKSYLAYPIKGKFRELRQALYNLPDCEVIAPKNSENLLVVITDTPSEADEKRLVNAFARLKSLRQLILVAGFGAVNSNQLTVTSI